MNLHIERVGHGPDLVMLHGWGMHGGVWNPVKAQLAQHFRLHLVDLPGFGHSAQQMPTPYALQTLVDEVAAQVPDNTLLCGWSFGGQVAMQWALQRPQQIRKLVLVSTTPKFVNAGDWQHGINQTVFNQFADGIQSDYQPAMTRFLSLQAQGGEDARDTVRELREHFFQRQAPSPEALAAGLALLQDNDLRATVPSVQLPTLILHGERDRVVPPASGLWLAEQMDNTQLELQPKASHAPFLSHPNWFAQTLIKYLQ
jgi:pimeloyl-[acyl-carrier protein] methyl ester esterase